jgi:uncharacterized membrane protein YoaK (UPF0700 family)
MTKTAHNFNQVLEKRNQLLWMCLAFHAGYLNAGGFLSSHRFVSHMTGFGTSIGVSVSEHEYLIALELILAPVAFMVGAAFAGYLVDKKIVAHREPRVITGILCILFMNLAVFAGGITGFFGVFGEPLLLQRDFLLLFMLTFTCGLQNGLFVSLTSGQIRTTHITGLVTDVGLSMVRSLVIKNPDTKNTEVRKNWLRINTILSFSTGSLLAAIIFQRLEYWGFMGSTMFSLFILALVSHIYRKASVTENPRHIV